MENPKIRFVISSDMDSSWPKIEKENNNFQSMCTEINSDMKQQQIYLYKFIICLYEF